MDTTAFILEVNSPIVTSLTPLLIGFLVATALFVFVVKAFR